MLQNKCEHKDTPIIADGHRYKTYWCADCGAIKDEYENKDNTVVRTVWTLPKSQIAPEPQEWPDRDSP